MTYLEESINFEALSDSIVGILIIIVAVALAILAVIASIFEIFLAIKYVKFNRTKNSADISGFDAARKILDANGLNKIKVKVSGSLLFGNSYSHYFKKIRLRRLTKKKKSISSLAMGAQKSCLAILDKEKDKDMKARIAITPLIYFGPIAFIPLILVGVLLDIIIFNFSGICTTICVLLGFLFYILSFVLSIKVLKTEKKAQQRAYQVLKENNLANDNEIEMMKELFHLYNIQYIIDMIVALLEMIYRVLMLIYNSKSSTSTKKD